LIIARGDIGENQLNAIKALSPIIDDADVKSSLIIVLSHWDAQARLAACGALMGTKGDKDVQAVASKRLPLETDEEAKRMLKKLAST
jgi:hypothetical protein